MQHVSEEGRNAKCNISLEMGAPLIIDLLWAAVHSVAYHLAGALGSGDVLLCVPLCTLGALLMRPAVRDRAGLGNLHTLVFTGCNLYWQPQAGEERSLPNQKRLPFSISC